MPKDNCGLWRRTILNVIEPQPELSIRHTAQGPVTRPQDVGRYVFRAIGEGL